MRAQGACVSPLSATSPPLTPEGRADWNLQEFEVESESSVAAYLVSVAAVVLCTWLLEGLPRSISGKILGKSIS